MSKHTLLFALVLVPAVAVAQQSVPTTERVSAPAPNAEAPNATTRAVLLANRPAQFTEAEWLRMMELPANRSLYPLRVTWEMLDTLDARALDLRYQYVMERE